MPKASLMVAYFFSIGVFSGFATAQTDTKRDSLCALWVERKLFTDDKIKIVLVEDHRILTGRLAKIDRTQLQLTLNLGERRKPILATYAFKEIAQVHYRARGKVQARFVFTGLFVGAIAGAAIGSLASEGSDSGLHAAAGFVIGAPAGMLLGLIVPVAIPRTEIVSCK